MKKYQKESVRLMAKFVKLSTNEVILSVPTDSMEVYQYFSNEFVDQVLKQTFGNKVDKIGDVLVVIDQTFRYK